MSQIRIDVSICIDSAILPWQPFRPQGLPEGLHLRPLRRLDDGCLRSAIVRIPAGWSSGGNLRLQSRQQFMLLTGKIQLGELSLQKNCYVCQEADRILPNLYSDKGAELVLITDGTPAFSTPINDSVEDAPFIIKDALSVPFTQPEMDGWDLSGVEERSLWKDELSGCETGLLTIPARFEGNGANFHPVNQEIFCIAGDIGPDNYRLMKPGWYLWNPAYGVHGFREHSRGGATVLRWHDGPCTLHMYEEKTPQTKL